MSKEGSDLSEIIKRKKAEEEGGDAADMDEKERRRQDIMRRVAERRKQREEQGAGVKATSAGISKLNEELVLKDAAHKKEVLALRKEIEELHGKVTQLQATTRSMDSLQSALQEAESTQASLRTQVENERSQNAEKQAQHEKALAEVETQRQEQQSALEQVKAENTALQSSLANLQQQVDSLTEMKNSEKSLDEKVAQLSEEITQKNNQLHETRQAHEALKVQLDEDNKKRLHAEEQCTAQKSLLTDAEERIFLLEKENETSQASLKELRLTLEEMMAVNAELREEIDYQKELVDKQEQQILEQAAMAVAATGRDTSLPPQASSQNASPVQLVEELVQEINCLRENPDAYTDLLLEYMKNGNEPPEGVSTLEETMDFLQSHAPCAPLELMESLRDACQSFCENIGQAGLSGPTTDDGLTLPDRVASCGSWTGAVQELTGLGSWAQSPRGLVLRWLLSHGDAEAQQRKALLSAEYQVLGVGHAPHTSEQFITSVVLATPASSTPSAPCAFLQESSDGEHYFIHSSPLPTQAGTQLTSNGNTITLSQGELMQEWNLPFSISPSNLSAKYLEDGVVQISMKKPSPQGNAGEQFIHEYTLCATRTLAQRLSIAVQQEDKVINFTTKPCNQEVQVRLKVLDGHVLCIESRHTEKQTENGSPVTRTITRKEKVALPFTITPDQVTCHPVPQSAEMRIQVNKPSTTTESVSIPIQ